ncbi:nitronate monooxygenase [Sneathiella sp. CAU 1612]|uniref:Nitronate monooxygenase n=2 Tax=Sneathiella sedimenti TaxID=2816034 RepID=A0ABS3F7G7_9PROT|nr:nitronate monooxygenase [Sneathiella sedimenti]
MSLVLHVVDAVNVPVIVTRGISAERCIAAAFVLGATRVQIATAYLFNDE